MQNPNEKLTYEQQEAQIAEKSQAFINLLTHRGILANPRFALPGRRKTGTATTTLSCSCRTIARWSG